MLIVSDPGTRQFNGDSARLATAEGSACPLVLARLCVWSRILVATSEFRRILGLDIASNWAEALHMDKKQMIPA